MSACTTRPYAEQDPSGVQRAPLACAEGAPVLVTRHGPRAADATGRHGRTLPSRSARLSHQHSNRFGSAEAKTGWSGRRLEADRMLPRWKLATAGTAAREARLDAGGPPREHPCDFLCLIRGLSTSPASEMSKLAGKQAAHIEQVFGYR